MCEGASWTPALWSITMSCIRKADGHLLGLLVQERKDVALVIGDKAQAGSEKSPTSLDQEEVGQDQGAKHLQSRDSTSGVPFFVCPRAVLQRNLVSNHQVSSFEGFSLSAHPPI